MIDIPTEPATERLPENISFWFSEAHALKDIADQSWKAEHNVIERLNSLIEPAHERQLHYSMVTLRMELNFLYRYLIALAIQHLAIGILMAQDAGRFLHQPPGHKIVELVKACEVTLTRQQEQLLRHTENALGWRNYFPVKLMRSDTKDSLQELNRILTEMEVMTDEEKISLDRLYAGLDAVARQVLTRTSTAKS